MDLEFRDYLYYDRYESQPLAAPCNPFTDIYYNDAKRKIKTEFLTLLKFCRKEMKGGNGATNGSGITQFAEGEQTF